MITEMDQIRPLIEYRDERGIVTQHPTWGGDAGDSAHRMGVLALFDNEWSYQETDYIQYFFTEKGILVRHPDGNPPWVREKDRSSRDQNTPWLAALAVKGTKRAQDLAWKITKAVLKNYSRFHNYRKNGTLDAPIKTPDFAGPKTWGLMIRANRAYWAYPLLYVFDLELLGGSIAWNYFRPDRDSDNINHICSLRAGVEVMPTLISKLALWVLDKEKAVAKLKHYWDFPGHSPEPNKDPGYLGEIMIKWLTKE